MSGTVRCHAQIGNSRHENNMATALNVSQGRGFLDLEESHKTPLAFGGDVGITPVIRNLIPRRNRTTRRKDWRSHTAQLRHQP